MTSETLLFLVVIVLIIAALPNWPHSRSWGFAPTGALSLFLVIFLFWAVAGGRPLFRSSGQNVKSTAQDVGEDIKDAGRDVADTVRDAVR